MHYELFLKKYNFFGIESKNISTFLELNPKIYQLFWNFSFYWVFTNKRNIVCDDTKIRDYRLLMSFLLLYTELSELIYLFDINPLYSCKSEANS